MARRSPSQRRRPSRGLLVWAMAAVLLLQGAAVAAWRAAGPAHRHVAADAALVLDDVRRGPATTVEPVGAHGHDHAHAGVARHHHGRGTAGVVLVDGEWQAADDTGDDGGATAASLAFLALPHPGIAFAVDPGGRGVRPAASWSLQTHVPAHPERPPRAG